MTHDLSQHLIYEALHIPNNESGFLQVLLNVCLYLCVATDEAKEWGKWLPYRTIKCRTTLMFK